MSSLDFDALRQRIAARWTGLPAPIGEEPWAESRYVYEQLGLDPQTYRHRNFAVRIPRAKAGTMPQRRGVPFNMLSTLELRALWRLTPRSQDDTRDSSLRVLQDVHAWLLAVGLGAQLRLEEVSHSPKADSEWLQLDWRYTATHQWGA